MGKVQRWRAHISRVLGREGGYPRTSCNVYKAAAQATLLFGTETWVVTPRIGNTLGGFRHRVARRLTIIRTRRHTTGRWVYPPLDVAMTAVGLEEVETYVLLLQNIIAQFIATCLIFNICLEAKQMDGSISDTAVVGSGWDQLR